MGLESERRSLQVGAFRTNVPQNEAGRVEICVRTCRKNQVALIHSSCAFNTFQFAMMEIIRIARQHFFRLSAECAAFKDVFDILSDTELLVKPSKMERDALIMN